jgi:hypothetical protein
MFITILCIYVHIYMYTCICMYIYTYVYTYICVYVYLYTQIYIFTYMYMYIYTYIYSSIYIHTYVCMYRLDLCVLRRTHRLDYETLSHAVILSKHHHMNMQMNVNKYLCVNIRIHGI